MENDTILLVRHHKLMALNIQKLVQPVNSNDELWALSAVHNFRRTWHMEQHKEPQHIVMLRLVLQLNILNDMLDC